MTSLKILSFGYALLALSVAYPTSIERARVLGRQEDVLDEYDYVIVGGGTAGLTVGDRLSEDGKCWLKGRKKPKS